MKNTTWYVDSNIYIPVLKAEAYQKSPGFLLYFLQNFDFIPIKNNIFLIFHIIFHI